jgi:flavin-dependent dehydrogenase
MPVRATKRGPERTPLEGSHDVLVCGASFAGLAVARELAGTGADVLVVDRYEIGERQTSACAAPTEWLEALGLDASIRQTFSTLVLKRPGSGDRRPREYRWELPWTFSTFDYRQLCALLAAQGEFTFETAKVHGRGAADGTDAITVRTDRGDLRAPVVVDALGWRRVLSDRRPIQPPNATLSRGLEVHPHDDAAPSKDLEVLLDPGYVVPGYSWSFPAADEVRVGVGSFDPRVGVKEPTVRLADDLGVGVGDEYQGNWIPHRLRPAVEDGVFFVGDSAGHCLPTTAEGIRTALYFGLAAGREIRRVVEGRQSVGQALDRYGSFSADHRWAFEWLLRTQRTVSRVNRLPLMDTALDLMDRPSFVRWAFTHYLNIAPPTFVDQRPSLAVAPWRAPAAVAA